MNLTRKSVFLEGAVKDAAASELPEEESPDRLAMSALVAGKGMVH